MNKVKVVKEIKWINDFPNRDEAYRVGMVENGKYFFAWGPDFPYKEELPSIDVKDGESGVSYHETEEDALKEMNDAVVARN